MTRSISASSLCSAIPSSPAASPASGLGLRSDALCSNINHKSTSTPVNRLTLLRPLLERHEALAAKHDMGVLPAREGQPEVIEPVIERHTGDADAATAHVGEIGQTQPTRRVLLPENDLLLGAVEPPPGTAAPPPPAPDAGAPLRMAAP